VVVLFSSRRRHTILQGDWSSDVCSSDLVGSLELERLQDLLLRKTRGAHEVYLADLGARAFLDLDLDLDAVAGRLLDVRIDLHARSEERRVGKECSSPGAANHEREETAAG